MDERIDEEQTYHLTPWRRAIFLFNIVLNILRRGNAQRYWWFYRNFDRIDRNCGLLTPNGKVEAMSKYHIVYHNEEETQLILISPFHWERGCYEFYMNPTASMHPKDGFMFHVRGTKYLTFKTYWHVRLVLHPSRAISYQDALDLATKYETIRKLRLLIN